MKVSRFALFLPIVCYSRSYRAHSEALGQSYILDLAQDCVSKVLQNFKSYVTKGLLVGSDGMLEYFKYIPPSPQVHSPTGHQLNLQQNRSFCVRLMHVNKKKKEKRDIRQRKKKRISLQCCTCMSCVTWWNK